MAYQDGDCTKETTYDPDDECIWDELYGNVSAWRKAYLQKHLK